MMLNPILIHELDELEKDEEINLVLMDKYPNVFIFLQKTHETMKKGQAFGL